MTLRSPGGSWFRLWSELVERDGKGERVAEVRWSSGSELTGASWFWSELTCSPYIIHMTYFIRYVFIACVDRPR